MSAQVHSHDQIENVSMLEYEHLAEDDSEIRVLSIFPGASTDDIHIQLSAISFDVPAADIPSYEALSYTWGSPKDPVRVFVRCEHGLRSLFVTKNCHEALQILRRPDKARTVWIDAICINQMDVKEKSRQVSIMRSIYGKAARVIVWLGRCADDSDRAMEWINALSLRIKYDRHNDVLESLDADRPPVTSSNPGASTMEVEAFTALLERPYFHRLWVWQEVRMGGDGTKVTCGDCETTFQALMTAVCYCKQKVGEINPTVIRLNKRATFMQSLPLNDVVDGMTALDRLRECQCTDQRDRIYTALAFGDFYDRLPMTPDYECSTRDVYVDFILRYLKLAGKDLRFLRYVGDCAPHDPTAGIADMPSWTPDWTQQNITSPLSFGVCSGSSATSFVSATRVQLTVQGVRVGSVQEVAAFGCNTLARPLYMSICRTLQSLLPNGVDDARLRRLVRVLTSSTYAEHFVPPPGGYATMDQCSRYLRQALQEHDLSSLDPKVAADTLIWGQELLLAQRHFHFCQGRSLFTTIDGEIGVGPEQMREGDTLAILLGCQYAMVLRPSEVDRDCYRVIGNALCTHIMDAEPLLGPLPSEFECVQILNEGDGSYRMPAFKNRLDGSVTHRDPRLPPLPPEWETLSGTATQEFILHSPLAYRNSLTQAVLDFRRDPRMDADALKERGIEIETFTLV
ncbi:hypothetical protein M409DRAFT_26123 [Zasmidium cellare ATCC 36951]|uniref:Heterokaryon incompatibility domain-containing protein n=1 Tax=Zasmidium cellare ATCC 36951 TaxID=1080233 RepID=A0A6A6C902_ZASCE|nr:uncharacterized protein M409DRAFT_26123 [Zasmidium cellare ATCC 36951]KAF2163511.1 hypothetical protein M409DRAFT_26123 [Zasmidium cellare ATCC 36951]